RCTGSRGTANAFARRVRLPSAPARRGSRCRSRPRTRTTTSATRPTRSGACTRASRAEERQNGPAPAFALLDPPGGTGPLHERERGVSDAGEELALGCAGGFELAVDDERLRLDARQVGPQVELCRAVVERLERAQVDPRTGRVHPLDVRLLRLAESR